MKLRCLPEDFQVCELSDRAQGERAASDRGEFALYRLTKCSLGSREAIDAVAERWRIPHEQISFGGLKDKHAVTRQFVTIADGPRQNQRQTNFELEYLGQTDRPFTSADIAGNGFRIVMRDMNDADVSAATVAISQVLADGLPNYFDDQRFGSLGQRGEFIAVPWCQGDYERALWLALADANDHDSHIDRGEKHVLREHWGDWSAIVSALPPSDRREIVEFLVRQPRDFRRALAMVRSDLRGLWLAAFQSVVWNRLLANTLADLCRPEQIFSSECGQRPVAFFRDLDERQRRVLRGLQLPLPSARLKLEPGPLSDCLRDILADYGLELRTMRTKYPRDSFFSKGDRAAIVAPGNYQHDFAADELYPGRRRLTLAFELPRGAYGTILVKRLSQPMV